MTADPYAFAAGYYDLFRARPDSWPPVGFFADLAPVGGQALEIGPGTGRITLAVAERAAGVHCLERSATMRAVLLAKLAARPDLRDRITILDGAAPDFDLARKFDYVYFAGVLEHIPPQARPALFRTVAAHLAPDGVLAMDMVLDLPVADEPERPRSTAQVGECRYELSVETRPRGLDLATLRHVYRTYHQNRLVATETMERDHHYHRRAAVLRDLATAGLVAIGGSVQHAPADQSNPNNPGTLVAQLAPVSAGGTASGSATLDPAASGAGIQR
ncbi:class I SAM-dependent methyltransferase [Micromonospora sp. NPDC047074]|uniref:class I SAM-dependent methyltransferase n=1 Tax=Micromonospora sp. NPDC047074 TaxID=3154339 RepID=UPI00340BF40B